MLLLVQSITGEIWVFVVGLFVGPVVGLLATDAAVRWAGSGWRACLAIALLLVFLLFAPFFALELKLGLIFGTLLGVLLQSTPFDLRRESTV